MTKTGMPLLANDPHRVLAEPSLRYMVHLVAPGWDVEGAGEPALPGVAVGHNQHIAWGFTIFGEDQEDFYVEQLNPQDPLEYKTPNGWARMKVLSTTIHVRGRADVHIDLKFTRHGPVLWEDGHRALALRWIGAEPGTAGYLGALAVDRAQNWKEFEAATASWKVPSENLVYADTQGNIGMYSAGLAPIRKNWTGLLPVPGAGGYEWSGFVPDADLPHSFNKDCRWCLRPAAQFTASANQRMIPENYPYKIGFIWSPGYRYRRILQVLAQDWTSGRKIDVADMENLQNDQVALPARELVSLLRQAMGPNPTPAQKMLAGWDGLVNEGAAPALYELWLENLTQAVRSRVVPEADKVVAAWPPTLLLQYLSHPTAAVFGPNPVQGRNRLMLDTLRSARERLEKLEGPDPAKWNWGQIHTLTFRHPLDELPGSKALLDAGPIPRPGDDYTVYAQYFNGPGPFSVLAGGSYKEIFSLANWDKSVAINVPGESGQPGSPYYGNLLPLWSTGRYFPLAYSKAEVEKVAAAKLVLAP
jgi:penicillin amidase